MNIGKIYETRLIDYSSEGCTSSWISMFIYSIYSCPGKIVSLAISVFILTLQNKKRGHEREKNRIE
jgi:hypothetical protein